MGSDEVQVCTYRGILTTPSPWKFVDVNVLSQLIQILETDRSYPGLLSVDWLLVVIRSFGGRD